MADHSEPRRDSALDNELAASLDRRFGLAANGTTVSIAVGIGLGFITHAPCKLLAALAALFAAKFAVSN